MKNEAERDLESALPPLRAAQRALSALNKADITEIKSFSKPPYLVQLTMEGICILLQVSCCASALPPLCSPA